VLEGNRVVAEERLLTELDTRLRDVHEGPDGALYVLAYEGWFGSTAQTHIGRIEYTGSCKPSEPKYPTAGTTALARDPRASPATVPGFHSFRVESPGAYTLKVLDAWGRELRTLKGMGPREYTASDLTPEKGILFVIVEDAQGPRIFRLIGF
jgi:hypothetical protein